MANEELMLQFIVFDLNAFAAEREKQGGQPANAVLGIVRAMDEGAAQDTASALTPGKIVFVRELDVSSKEFIAAARKMGFLNKSEAHEY